MHYIANVVKEKYLQVALFYNELHYVEKAAAGTVCRRKKITRCNATRLISLLSNLCDHTLEDLYFFLSLSVCVVVSLENVLLDVKELQRGMELTKREYSMHGHNTLLKDFIHVNESKLKKIQDDAKIAQVPKHPSVSP